MPHFVRDGSIGLGLFMLLVGGGVAQAAGDLTRVSAERAINHCLKGNGTPQVTEISRNEPDAVAKVQVTNFRRTDGTHRSVTGAGHAVFTVYNDGTWMLRNFTGPRGAF